jgi:hypothetical protein
MQKKADRLCVLVVRVPAYRFRGPGSIPAVKLQGLEANYFQLVNKAIPLTGLGGL